MTFGEVLEKIQELLQREQGVSYRGLKRRFDLDDEYLEDVKEWKSLLVYCIRTKGEESSDKAEA